MGWFGKKKEEKKKFDYSEETKELFAERDAFYAEQRRSMGGGEQNPELAEQRKSEPNISRDKEVENLLEDSGDFNPYVGNDESPSIDTQSAPTSTKAASSAFVCVSCGKDFQEKWGKCPSCGGEMKKAENQVPAPSPVASSTSSSSPESSIGDPLDDLLGDFGSSDGSAPQDPQESSDESSIKMVNTDDLTSDFGESRSNHSKRKKVRKVRKVKRSRKSP